MANAEGTVRSFQAMARTPDGARPANQVPTTEGSEIREQAIRRWISMFNFSADKLRKKSSIPGRKVRGHRHLDIGVHYGDSLKILSPTARHIIGFDIDATKLEEARVRKAEVGHSGDVEISLLQMDAHHIGLEDNSCDSITLSDVLRTSGANDARKILAEAKRVLRPGGKIVISFKGKSLERHLRESLAIDPETLQHVQDTIYGTRVSVEELVDIVTEVFPNAQWYGQDLLNERKIDRIIPKRWRRKSIDSSGRSLKPKEIEQDQAEQYPFVLALAQKENPNKRNKLAALRAKREEITRTSQEVALRGLGVASQQYRRIDHFVDRGLNLYEQRGDVDLPVRSRALIPALEKLTAEGWFDGALVMELGIGPGIVNYIGPVMRTYIGVDYSLANFRLGRVNFNTDPRFRENGVRGDFAFTDVETFLKIWNKTEESAYRGQPIRAVIDLPVGLRKDLTAKKWRFRRTHENRFREKWDAFGLGLMGNSLRLLRLKANPNTDEAVVVVPGFIPQNYLAELFSDAHWDFVDEVFRARVPLKPGSDISWVSTISNGEDLGGFYDAEGRNITIGEAIQAQSQFDFSRNPRTLSPVHHDVVVVRLVPGQFNHHAS